MPSHVELPVMTVPAGMSAETVMPFDAAEAVVVLVTVPEMLPSELVEVARDIGFGRIVTRKVAIEELAVMVRTWPKAGLALSKPVAFEEVIGIVLVEPSLMVPLTTMPERSSGSPTW